MALRLDRRCGAHCHDGRGTVLVCKARHLLDGLALLPPLRRLGLTNLRRAAAAAGKDPIETAALGCNRLMQFCLLHDRQRECHAVKVGDGLRDAECNAAASKRVACAWA